MVTQATSVPVTFAPEPDRDAQPDVPRGEAAKRDAELAEKVAVYVDAFLNMDPVWMPDGKRVAFISNRDGLPQLYTADATQPSAAATRLVATPERVGTERPGGGFATPTRDGKAVLLRSDLGADENWSIFRAEIDGSGVHELTPGEPLSRSSPIEPDGLRGTMFFMARKQGEARSTLYEASTTTPGTAKAIYTSEAPMGLAGDKDRLVVTGGSYGGYTTLMALARWPDLWRAGVTRGGIVDLRSWMATTNPAARKTIALEFGDPEQDDAFLAEISPITHVDKIVAPTFVMVGENDPRVPRSESDQLVKALRQRKIPVEYMVAPKEGHSLSRRETQIEYYSRSARFIEAALRAP